MKISRIQSFQQMHSMVKFAYFIVGAIIVALILVIVAMYMYRSSGAAQLDLSRPAYNAIRTKASGEEKFDGIEPEGKLTNTVYDAFEKMYDQKAKEVQQKKDGFNSEQMNDAVLGIKAVN
jgi:hypothetical protein